MDIIAVNEYVKAFLEVEASAKATRHVQEGAKRRLLVASQAVMHLPMSFLKEKINQEREARRTAVREKYAEDVYEKRALRTPRQMVAAWLKGNLAVEYEEVESHLASHKDAAEKLLETGGGNLSMS